MYERRKCLWKKIKADQEIEENGFPIETEHGNLDSLAGFNGDSVITMDDLNYQILRRLKKKD